MALIKLEALRALASFLECQVPELAGKVCVGQAEANHLQEYPHMVLLATGWRFEPDQSGDFHQPGPERLVSDVGTHRVTVEMRLGAQTSGERYTLGQKVLDVFLAGGSADDLDGELHPGVLRVPVLAAPEYGNWFAAWEIDAEEWEDEKAFDQAFYSVLELQGAVPALVSRRRVFRLDEIRAQLDEGAQTETQAITE